MGEDVLAGLVIVDKKEIAVSEYTGKGAISDFHFLAPRSITGRLKRTRTVPRNATEGGDGAFLLPVITSGVAVTSCESLGADNPKQPSGVSEPS
jgi:hypothetical protein